jgi:type I restriction enzyme S subunit
MRREAVNVPKSTSGIGRLRPLPPGWQWVRLGRLATYQNGRAFKPEDWSRNGLPIIRIENLTNPKASYNCYRGEVEERHLIDTGDLLLSWSASLDAFIWDRGRAVLNQHIFKVCEDKTRVTRSFLYFLLRATMDHIRTQIHGATMQHITKPKFESVLVPVPTETEKQYAIAARLEAQMAEVRRLRRATERQLEAAQGLHSSLVAQAMAQTGNADGQMHQILASPPKSGWSPSCDDKPGGTPVLTLSSVLNFRYDGTQVKLTSMPTDERVDYWVKKGDILISRSNTPALVGHAAICDGTPERAIFSDLLIRLEIAPSHADVSFVLYWLMSPIIRDFITRNARGTSGTMKKVTREMLRQMPFPTHLSVERQKSIACALDQKIALSMTALAAAERQMEAINALPGVLLHEVFGGFEPPSGSELMGESLKKASGN